MSSDTRTLPGDSTHAPAPSVGRGLFWVHPEERWCPLPQGTTLIGRGEDAGIRISGSQVSRRHATLHVAGPRVILRDEGSLNKVRCNLTALPECQISNNDVIRVGDWVGVLVEGVKLEDPSVPLFREERGGALVGPRSEALWQTLKQVAPGTLPIVIEGETGTGKELVARALHEHSGRPGPFVAVNCAAQPEALFEALFFGHTKGAFTGAVQATPGFFAASDRGTLFMDEVVELGALQQAKVLRVIEEGRVMPVGSTQSEAVDLRIVCAAQRPLPDVVDQGKFRPDLFARLNGFTLRLLPLRARKEEVLRLFTQLLRMPGARPRLSAGFVERLCAHSWPLNVRELVTVAARVQALFSGEEELLPRHFSEALGSGGTLPPDADAKNAPADPGLSVRGELGSRTQAWLDRHRHLVSPLTEALGAANGNVSRAARQLGLSRQQAQRILDALARERGERQ